MTPGSRMLHQDWSGQNLTGGGNFYFCGFLNHLDFSSSFPLTLAQVFIDFSTESESPLPRLPSQFSGLYSRSARNGVIQLWPTGSYSLCKYLSSPCEILSTTQDTWGMSRREWFQGVQCVAFFIFKQRLLTCSLLVVLGLSCSVWAQQLQSTGSVGPWHVGP